MLWGEDWRRHVDQRGIEPSRKPGGRYGFCKARPTGRRKEVVRKRRDFQRVKRPRRHDVPKRETRDAFRHREGAPKREGTTRNYWREKIAGADLGQRDHRREDALGSGRGGRGEKKSHRFLTCISVALGEERSRGGRRTPAGKKQKSEKKMTPGYQGPTVGHRKHPQKGNEGLA